MSAARLCVCVQLLTASLHFLLGTQNLPAWAPSLATTMALQLSTLKQPLLYLQLDVQGSHPRGGAEHEGRSIWQWHELLLYAEGQGSGSSCSAMMSAVARSAEHMAALLCFASASASCEGGPCSCEKLPQKWQPLFSQVCLCRRRLFKHRLLCTGHAAGGSILAATALTAGQRCRQGEFGSAHTAARV